MEPPSRVTGLSESCMEGLSQQRPTGSSSFLKLMDQISFKFHQLLLGRGNKGIERESHSLAAGD